MADYTVRREESYEAGQEAIFKAALGAVDGLGGKVLKQDAGAGSIEAQFDKKIHGKVLGDRTRAEIAIGNSKNGVGRIAVALYPVDPVGRKLQFGARKGVPQKVLGWFFAHLEHRLGTGD